MCVLTCLDQLAMSPRDVTSVPMTSSSSTTSSNGRLITVDDHCCYMAELTTPRGRRPVSCQTTSALSDISYWLGRYASRSFPVVSTAVDS